MSDHNQPEFHTESEYWEMEAAAFDKHEFIGGQIYGRAQSSSNHTAICANVLVSANALLRGKPYRVFNGDIKIKVEATGDSFYPDAAIHCPPARFVGEGEHTLLTPKILFEVTMPATRNFDREGKLLSYEQIETLTDYVLIDAERACVEHFSRNNPFEDWRWRLHTKRSDVAKFLDLEIELPLAEIYDDVEVSEDWLETQMKRAHED